MINSSKLRPFYVVAASMVLLSIGRVTFGQVPGTTELTEAYKALAEKDYTRAVPLFRRGLALQPGNAGAHKDLAYALLKTGENAESRDEFAAALKLNAKDETAALEYAFLAYETKSQLKRAGRSIVFVTALIRRLAPRRNRLFRISTARSQDGIARWQEAIRRSPNPNDLSFLQRPLGTGAIG